ncbi:hypothetical protein RRF57_007169 [Xylaria bambusicola]|uniref:Uncharacterized protein n=1 Tax=Xylaria bambusicola TaxID=326684 RepID=A0AAN7UFS5_9PEZI
MRPNSDTVPGSGADGPVTLGQASEVAVVVQKACLQIQVAGGNQGTTDANGRARGSTYVYTAAKYSRRDAGWS